MTKKTAQITVRLAQAGDLEACLGLNHRFETTHVWQLAQQEEGERLQVVFQTMRLPRPLEVEYPRSAVDLRLDLATMHGVLVAESATIILGYIHLTLSPADRNTWVRNFVVDAPWRRRGIGRLLLEQAKAWGRLQQMTHLMLEATTRSYPAIRFALGQGMLFCGFNDRYYPSQEIAVFFGQNL